MRDQAIFIVVAINFAAITGPVKHPSITTAAAREGWKSRTDARQKSGKAKNRRRSLVFDRALAGAERLEGDDGMGVLDAGNDLYLLVDEVADIGVVVDVELYQEIVVARGGINLGGNLGLG